jgi:hypothetical protein
MRSSIRMGSRHKGGGGRANGCIVRKTTASSLLCIAVAGPIVEVTNCSAGTQLTHNQQALPSSSAALAPAASSPLLHSCSHVRSAVPGTMPSASSPKGPARDSQLRCRDCAVLHPVSQVDGCAPSSLTFSHTTMARRLNRSAAESLNRTVAPYTSPRTSSAVQSAPVPLPLPLLPPLLLCLLLLLLLPGVPFPLLLLGPGPACSCSSRCTEHLLKSE